MRVFAAFFSAPLVIAIGWTVIGYLSYGPISRPLSEHLLEMLVFAIMVYTGAATFTAIIALPLYLLFRRLDLVRDWTAGIVGIVTGGTAGVLLGNVASPPGVLGLSVLGGLAGLVFWRVGGFSAERKN